MEAGVLEALQALGPPVHAVRGNVDSAELQARLPATRTIDADGARIAMLHDAGPASGRLARMRRRFPGAQAVVFGHSHIPLHEADRDGFQIFNPGSPTERRPPPPPRGGAAGAGLSNPPPAPPAAPPPPPPPPQGPRHGARGPRRVGADPAGLTSIARAPLAVLPRPRRLGALRPPRPSGAAAPG